jgi:hypothetical protein
MGKERAEVEEKKGNNSNPGAAPRIEKGYQYKRCGWTR